MGILIFLCGFLFFAYYVSNFKKITQSKLHLYFLIGALILSVSSGVFFEGVRDAVDDTYLSTDTYIARICGAITGTMIVQGAFFVLSVFVAIIGLFQQRMKIKEEKAAIEDAARVAALDELESGKFNRLAWARATEESDGNESRVKSLYIKFRVEQVLKEQKEQERREQECKTE